MSSSSGRAEGPNKAVVEIERKAKAAYFKGRGKKTKGSKDPNHYTPSNDRLSKLPPELFAMVTKKLRYDDKKRLKLTCKSLRDAVGQITCDTYLENLTWQSYLLLTTDPKVVKKWKMTRWMGPAALELTIRDIDEALGHYYADVANDIRVLGQPCELPWDFETDEKMIWTGKYDWDVYNNIPKYLDPSEPLRPRDFGKHLVEPLMHNYGSSKRRRPYRTLAYQIFEIMARYMSYASSNSFRWLGGEGMQWKQLSGIYGRLRARIEVRQAKMVEYAATVKKAQMMVSGHCEPLHHWMGFD